MVDVRCKNCNGLLLKASLLVGAIKCHRCRIIFEYKIYSNVHLTNQYDAVQQASEQKTNIPLETPLLA